MTAERIRAGYVRVSSAAQRDTTDSPASQRQRLEAAGCTAIYQDLAVSGYRLEQRRKASDWQRLIADIKAGRVAELLAVRLDRLARRDQLIAELAELCHVQGVRFATLAGGTIDVGTASGWLGLKVQSVFAEHFSRALSESIRTGYAGLHAAGIPARSAASLPFHLQRVPGTRHDVEPSPHWPAARLVVDRILSGQWRPAEAATYLQQRCRRSWAGGEVRRWLRRPALAGHMARRDGTIQIRDCWPALVSDAELTQLQKLLDRTKGQRLPTGRPAGLLSGVCRCAICGGSMNHDRIRRPSGTYHYLRCRRPGCNHRNVPASPIWEQILDQLDAHIETLVARRAADADAQQEPAEVSAWRRELEARQALPVEMQQAADRLRIQELKGLIAAASAMPSAAADWWPDGLAVGSLQFWSSRPEDQINADLRRLIRAAIVDPATRRLERVDWSA